MDAGSHGPAHLDERIDAFLEGYLPSLASMPEDELEGHRRSLIAAKLQKDHTLAEEADRNWEQISNRRCALPLLLFSPFLSLILSPLYHPSGGMLQSKDHSPTSD